MAAASPGNGEDKRQFPRTATDEFLFRQFQGKILSRETVGTVAASAGTILQNNPERVAFLLVNTSAGSITLRLSQQVTSGAGIVLGPNGGFFRMSILEDGGPCGWEWFAIGSSAGLSYYVLEQIRYTGRKATE